MHTPEIQMPQAGRRRGRYSDEFKRQVIAACLEPGVSTAAIALANGLNANLARRWVAESAQRSDTRLSKTATTLAPVHTNPAFIPVKFESVPPAPAILQADIRIELQHGATTVHIHWPLSASSQCAQWVREVLA
ncbi:MAG: transposase [Rhodoferax sp.]|uniref:IS66-like element accessory protein TnpA n=1 Tax=Rhodoferax sp. TaxID=50421 RepID=UPI0017987056|nr:transposase [Rhodoferax sp.]NMM21582.1 transposase [Rhodoferax sp.]